MPINDHGARSYYAFMGLVFPECWRKKWTEWRVRGYDAANYAAVIQFHHALCSDGLSGKIAYEI